MIGVATEATRTAANGQAFLDRVAAETGIELARSRGGREAELTFLGLDGLVDLAGDVIVADIGGGSTEIILARDRQVRFSQIVSDRFGPSDRAIRALRSADAERAGERANLRNGAVRARHFDATRPTALHHRRHG